MNYTVVWLPAAESRLADLWMDAGVRKYVASAADSIDEMLGAAPNDVGESRDDDRRVLFVWPLGVIYRIREGDQIVQVSEVWQYDVFG